MLAPLAPEEREVLLRLLTQIALANNELSRAPLKLGRSIPQDDQQEDGEKRIASARKASPPRS